MHVVHCFGKVMLMYCLGWVRRVEPMLRLARTTSSRRDDVRAADRMRDPCSHLRCPWLTSEQGIISKHIYSEKMVYLGDTNAKYVYTNITPPARTVV